jgi:hypothetical protein
MFKESWKTEVRSRDLNYVPYFVIPYLKLGFKFGAATR